MYVDFHTHRPAQNAVYNLHVFEEAPAEQDFSAGLHPWWIAEYPIIEMKTWFQSLFDQPRLVAIGECGLDKSIATPLNEQAALFDIQIQWAIDLQLPLIVHCVRAHQECLNALKPAEGRVPVIFHGFIGSVQLAEQIAHRGHYIGLAPRRQNHRLWNSIAHFPLDRIVVETDDTSNHIREVYTDLAAAKNMELLPLISFMQGQALSIFGPKMNIAHGS